MDATHNENGAKHLYKSLTEVININDGVIITSILADKDILGMLKWFAKIAKTIIFTQIKNNPRTSKIEALTEKASGLFTQIYVKKDASQALEMAYTLNKKMILITGSLYLLSEFKEIR